MPFLRHVQHLEECEENSMLIKSVLSNQIICEIPINRIMSHLKSKEYYTGLVTAMSRRICVKPIHPSTSIRQAAQLLLYSNKYCISEYHVSPAQGRNKDTWCQVPVPTRWVGNWPINVTPRPIPTSLSPQPIIFGSSGRIWTSHDSIPTHSQLGVCGRPSFLLLFLYSVR